MTTRRRFPSTAATVTAMMADMPAAPGRPVEHLTPAEAATLRRVMAAERHAEQQFHRRQTATRATIRRLREQGTSMAAISREIGCSRQTVYRMLGETEPT